MDEQLYEQDEGRPGHVLVPFSEDGVHKSTAVLGCAQGAMGAVMAFKHLYVPCAVYPSICYAICLPLRLSHLYGCPPICSIFALQIAVPELDTGYDTCSCLQARGVRANCQHGDGGRISSICIAGASPATLFALHQVNHLPFMQPICHASDLFRSWQCSLPRLWPFGPSCTCMARLYRCPC